MSRDRLLTTLLAISLLFLFSCSNKQSYRRAGFYMGTVLELDVPVGKKTVSEIKRVCNLAELEISRLDAMLSIFNGSGAISKINNDTEKHIVSVPPELYRLIKKAKEYCNLTQGAFDITVEPLTELWGFGPGKKSLPDAEKIKDVLQYVGLDKISLNEKDQTLIFKNPMVKMDFGGLAKGYAIDEVVKLLKKYNISKAIVNMGGDLYCLGANSDDNGWTIGIKDPENKNELLVQLKVRDKAIATSGIYENFYIYNDKKYVHIIDPRTGYTVSNNLTSVTILAEDCATADALATAVCVLGEREGLGLIEKLSGVDCILVVEQMGKSKIRMSSGMKKYKAKRL